MARRRPIANGRGHGHGAAASAASAAAAAAPAPAGPHPNRVPRHLLPPGVAGKQLEYQRKCSAHLQAALHQSFTITHSFEPRLAAVSYTPGTPAPPLNQLVALDMYSVAWNWTLPDGTRLNNKSDFKWRGTCFGLEHCLEHAAGRTTSCDFYGTLQFYEDERIADEDTLKYREGGLHYFFTFAGGDDQSTGYGLVLNFVAHGNCLPWARCHCDPGQSAPSAGFVAMRDKWDAILRRAKEDPCSVECMFHHTPQLRVARREDLPLPAHGQALGTVGI